MTLKVLTMLTLSAGRVFKVCLSPFPFKNLKTLFFSVGGTPNILSAARHVLIDWNHQKIPIFSEPPVVHTVHIPSTVPSSGGQVAPGT